ncbi:sugar phosphate nucleotidyltransferase [Methylobacterium durans]|uniref:sugar phosphate nucleotidyltransferase n=1 Tax=Methylobacterium durans TaxID=2202825 RepID=UPI002AFE9031|nr:sugar phosphate nucleotidyltransferase [Methylobacterium durans]MEA1834419.1 sugar phosphate nucleotidyltransferase [Methylobacterium durans]
MKAVIQCGGRGSRLMPYTMVLPKPLMPVGSRPVLELLIGWLCRNGISEVIITTGYLGCLIKTLFGDGSKWGIDITYTDEVEPLGTIGPLSLLRDVLDEPFVVMNGDVLTDLNLARMIDFHARMDASVTIATIARQTKLDFGVLEGPPNGRIQGFREKPCLTHHVSMGVYFLQPDVIRHIPRGMPFGFDDLILRLLSLKTKVVSYRHDGLWLDIGRVEDFKKAQELPWNDLPPAYEAIQEFAEAALV